MIFFDVQQYSHVGIVAYQYRFHVANIALNSKGIKRLDAYFI